ncbi:MAG TPA: DUF4259 domain-containing protein [Phycisphaerae bacterium]|nr:DUF4259 domain-containing protein [Phycisphaerae bacterium]
MGTWAEGNFDNDTALDLVGDIAQSATDEMTPPDAVEDVDLVMAAVAIRKVLVEHCNAPRPEPSQLKKLKAQVLAIYDEEIDGLEPEPQYKIARRKVIAQTFDDFLKLLSK